MRKMSKPWTRPFSENSRMSEDKFFNSTRLQRKLGHIQTCSILTLGLKTMINVIIFKHVLHTPLRVARSRSITITTGRRSKNPAKTQLMIHRQGNPGRSGQPQQWGINKYITELMFINIPDQRGSAVRATWPA